MPQLPSGQPISISADRALAAARDGQLADCPGFTMQLNALADLAPLIDIVPYQVEATVMNEEEGAQAHTTEHESDPVFALTLADLYTSKCDWSAQDKSFFVRWLESPKVLNWLQAMFEELSDLMDAAEDVDTDVAQVTHEPSFDQWTNMLPTKTDTRRRKR